MADAVRDRARADEILGLDVPDLDLSGKRGRVISKGGTTDWVHWQTGTAMLLPRLLAGRREGPVFLTARKPARAVASGDLCPVTRRARLSYRRAAESFELATRPLANPGASHEKLEKVHGVQPKTHDVAVGESAIPRLAAQGDGPPPFLDREQDRISSSTSTAVSAKATCDLLFYRD